MYEWDSAKAFANLVKHGVMFETAERFDWRTALVRIDTEHSRDEHRYVSVGFIDERLYVMVWTPRRAAIRIIGLRKANDRERKLYEKTA